jgi:hypothetical protein
VWWFGYARNANQSTHFSKIFRILVSSDRFKHHLSTDSFVTLNAFMPPVVLASLLMVCSPLWSIDSYQYRWNKGEQLILRRLCSILVRKYLLSLCIADGSMRKTNKSKQLKQILSRVDTCEVTDFRTRRQLINDLMALRNTMSTNSFYLFEILSWNLLSAIPKGYHRVDFVADCYFEYQ